MICHTADFCQFNSGHSIFSINLFPIKRLSQCPCVSIRLNLIDFDPKGKPLPDYSYMNPDPSGDHHNGSNCTSVRFNDSQGTVNALNKPHLPLKTHISGLPQGFNERTVGHKELLRHLPNSKAHLFYTMFFLHTMLFLLKNYMCT